MKEAELQTNVTAVAKYLGYRVAHFRPALTSKGWRTPVSADGKGFPDLVLCRGPRLMFIELKAASGKTSPDQDAWLAELDQTCAEVHLWMPVDWLDGTIEKTLR